MEAIQNGVTTRKIGFIGDLVSDTASIQIKATTGTDTLKHGDFFKFENGKAVQLSSNSDTIGGVIINNQKYDIDTIADGEIISILKSGVVYVTSETAVNIGDAVHVRVAGVGNIGEVTNTADGSNTIATSATFAGTTTTAGIASIHININ